MGFKHKIIGISRVLSLLVRTLVRFDFGAIRMLPVWLRTIKKGSPLEDRIPRLSLGAISWLNKYLDRQKIVFEYGSGGSTLYFVSRVKKLISVEHDGYWYKKIKTVLEKEHISNCEYIYAPPTRGKSEYISSLKEYSGLSFKKYAKSIDSYDNCSFDLVLVDGRARVSCLENALKKVRIGGYIMLDNAEREKYSAAFEKMKKYKRIDFFGPSPYLANNFVKTCLWKIE